MERFVFRLENVLRLRKKIEEGTELEFSKKKAELVKVENEIKDTEKKFGTFIHENSHIEGTFTAFEIVAVDNYIHKVRDKIKQLNGRRVEREQQAIEALDVLKEVRKSRKIIENLKERKLERYLEDLEREENADIDDVSQKIRLNRERLTIEDIPMEEM